MDCKQISNLLNAYADSELSKSDQTLVESHLAECSDCREELEDIRRLDATMRCEELAPDPLRSLIADRLEAARRTGGSRSSIKEKLGMKFRIGMAAIGAAALIVVLTMSSHGNAMAAYARMKKAVTTVTSAHLHIEMSGPIDLGDVTKPDATHALGNSDKDGDTDGSADMLAMGIGAAIGGGNKSIDVWSKGDKWKAQVFGKIDALYSDGYVTVMFGDKVMTKVKVDPKDMPFGKSGDPTDLGDFLTKGLTKATDEMSKNCIVQNVGSVQDNGRTLQTLEVTSKNADDQKWKLMYWVDESTNLPARFQIFAKDDSGQQKLVCSITCDYNENYPDSMFEAGADKP